MIKKLDWDSEFFGFNIAHLDIKETLEETFFIDNFVQTSNINLVQAICDIANIKTINLLEKSNFTFIDLRMEYKLNLSKIEFDKSDILIATTEDIPVLKEIANSVFIDSRYYALDRFDKVKVDRLFQIWLEKSVVGQFDDVVLTIKEGDLPVGFVTVKFSSNNNAKIGLIGIDSKVKNKGLGSRLMGYLFTFLKNKDIKTLEVVTQGKNLKAQNFYIKHGFRMESIKSWYYKFFDV